MVPSGLGILKGSQSSKWKNPNIPLSAKRSECTFCWISSSGIFTLFLRNCDRSSSCCCCSCCSWPDATRAPFSNPSESKQTLWVSWPVLRLEALRGPRRNLWSRPKPPSAFGRGSRLCLPTTARISLNNVQLTTRIWVCWSGPEITTNAHSPNLRHRANTHKHFCLSWRHDASAKAMMAFPRRGQGSGPATWALRRHPLAVPPHPSRGLPVTIAYQSGLFVLFGAQPLSPLDRLQEN